MKATVDPLAPSTSAFPGFFTTLQSFSRIFHDPGRAMRSTGVTTPETSNDGFPNIAQESGAFERIHSISTSVRDLNPCTGTLHSREASHVSNRLKHHVGQRNRRYPGDGDVSRIPSIHFDTAEAPEAERLEAWRAAVPLYELSLPEGSGPASCRVSSDAWMLGAVIVTIWQLGPVRLTRSPDSGSAPAGGQLSLVLPRQGGWVCETLGRMLTVAPGQAILLDLSRPFRMTGNGNEVVTLTLTRSALASAGVSAGDVHGLLIEGLAARVLADHVGWLIRQLAAMDARDAPAAMTGTLAVIAACLGANPEPQSATMRERDARVRRRVDRYIDENLGLRDLTSGRICRAVGVSRSVLYRAFAPLGGVADHIRARRLEAAHALLEDPACRRTISGVASHLGFASDAHFSRAFKQRFGYCPRQARGRQPDGPGAVAAPIDPRSGAAIFAGWLAQIGPLSR